MIAFAWLGTDAVTISPKLLADDGGREAMHERERDVRTKLVYACANNSPILKDTRERVLLPGATDS
jgi:hypothetical protein